MERLLPDFSTYQFSNKINRDIEDVLMDYKCIKLANPYNLKTGEYYLGDEVVRYEKSGNNYYISVNLFYYKNLALHHTFFHIILDANGKKIDSYALFGFDENLNMMEDLEIIIETLSSLIICEIDTINRNKSLDDILLRKNEEEIEIIEQDACK